MNELGVVVVEKQDAVSLSTLLVADPAAEDQADDESGHHGDREIKTCHHVTSTQTRPR